MVYVWLGLIVAFIAVEAATVNLVSIWFIGGSVAGLVCAILGAPTLLQFAVFILVSALLLALLRPLLKKYLRVKPSRTNADRLLGQEALVTEDIDNLRETGAIRINGVLWTAKSVDDTQIPSGSRVVIARIEGAKVLSNPPEFRQKHKATPRNCVFALRRIFSTNSAV